jgi:hypothetical protein
MTDIEKLPEARELAEMLLAAASAAEADAQQAAA